MYYVVHNLLRLKHLPERLRNSQYFVLKSFPRSDIHTSKEEHQRNINPWRAIGKGWGLHPPVHQVPKEVLKAFLGERKLMLKAQRSPSCYVKNCFKVEKVLPITETLTRGGRVQGNQRGPFYLGIFLPWPIGQDKTRRAEGRPRYGVPEGWSGRWG